MALKLDIRDPDRRYRFSAEVDLSNPPALLHPPQPENPEALYLQWDQAIDDAGHLRRCPVCGCRDLYQRKDMPQLTGFAAILLGGALAITLFGFDQALLAVVLFLIVALFDALIFFKAKRCLTCYHCVSTFRDAPISPHQKSWQMSVAERYPRKG